VNDWADIRVPKTTGSKYLIFMILAEAIHLTEGIAQDIKELIGCGLVTLVGTLDLL
jgi:hypothetical protein